MQVDHLARNVRASSRVVRARPAPRSSAAPAAMVPAAAAQQAATAESSSPVDFKGFEEYVLDLQERILTEAEQLDGSGKKFIRDKWSRGSDNAGARPGAQGAAGALLAACCGAHACSC